MNSKAKRYRVYVRNIVNLARCLSTFDTHESADQFAQTMTKLGWRDLNIFTPATPDTRPSQGV